MTKFSMAERSGSQDECQRPAPRLSLSCSEGWIAGAGSPAQEPAGHVVSPNCYVAAVQVADVSAVASHAEQLIDALPHIVWTTDAQGRIMSANSRWLEFAGVKPAAGLSWTELVHPEDRIAANGGWQDHLACGGTFEAHHRLVRHDGTDEWALVRAEPMRAPDGSIAAWCGTFTGIDALKSSETRQDFLASELAHRIQNIFAMVESLLSMSARNQPQAAEFVAAACARIRSLARANSYIRPQHGAALASDGQATLYGLIETLLAPYQDVADQTGAAIIALSGPDHAIGTTCATLLALVVHELATNAVKYGALSQAGGRVVLATSHDMAPDASMLHLVWSETGGPAVRAPDTSGFGTQLIDRALRQPLGARVERVWSHDGLIVRISLPCAQLTR